MGMVVVRRDNWRHSMLHFIAGLSSKLQEDEAKMTAGTRKWYSVDVEEDEDGDEAAGDDTVLGTLAYHLFASQPRYLGRNTEYY